jgi:hypothetical protein
MEKGAILSECNSYRYQLWRIWNNELAKVLFIMLNPSTADADIDDPTIRRCIGFAKAWGYGGLYVCNLFAYRATDPKELLKIDNPFGDANIWHTRELVDKVEKVICAWGNRPILKKVLKGQSEMDLVRFAEGKLHAIDLAKDGTPKHPLYLKSSLKPVIFNPQNDNNDGRKV